MLIRQAMLLLLSPVCPSIALIDTTLPFEPLRW